MFARAPVVAVGAAGASLLPVAAPAPAGASKAPATMPFTIPAGTANLFLNPGVDDGACGSGAGGVAIPNAVQSWVVEPGQAGAVKL